ncbi:MAG: hypothetical protein PHE84_01245 [bacterium]|nr:hypothetical protein [bacterium]
MDEALNNLDAVKSKTAQCKVCRLAPEIRDQIHGLHFGKGLSLRAIARKVNSEYLTEGRVGLNSSNLFNHFRHVPQEALALYEPPAQAKASEPYPIEPLPADVIRNKAQLFQEQVAIHSDLKKRLEKSKAKLDLNPDSDEDKGLFGHLAIAKEMRMSIELLDHLLNPHAVMNATANFIERKAIKSLENLGREMARLRSEVLALTPKEAEASLDAAFKDLALRVARFEREDVTTFQEELRRTTFGLPMMKPQD